jgi:hypothetical protein
MRVVVTPKLQAEHGHPQSAHGGSQHAGGQPHPLLAGLTEPEDPRPTSTAECPSSQSDQEAVGKQQHRPLLTLGGATCVSV